MDATDKIVLDLFKNLIQKRLALDEMILFGSRARGDADDDSDMDVVVIIEGTISDEIRDYVSDCAWEAGFKQGIVVVPTVFSRNEWERGLGSRSLFVRAIQEEGISL